MVSQKTLDDLISTSEHMYNMLQELVRRAGNDESNELAEHLAMAQISLSCRPDLGQKLVPFGLLDAKVAIERAKFESVGILRPITGPSKNT